MNKPPRCRSRRTTTTKHVKTKLIVAAIIATITAVAIAGTGIKCRNCNGTGWSGSFKCTPCGGDGEY